MQDTFAFASQAINHALGVEIDYQGNRFAGTAQAVLASGSSRFTSGDVAVSSRTIEVHVTATDFDAESMAVEDWIGGTVRFNEGPLSGQTLDVANARPDIEGVSVVLTLKRGK